MAFAVLFSSFSSTGLPLSDLEVLDICDLAGNLESYKGKAVRVTGVLFTDWRESSGLVSPQCPNVMVAFSPTSPASPSIDNAWDEMLAKRFRPDVAIEVEALGVVQRS